jgi:hypothetical protein
MTFANTYRVHNNIQQKIQKELYWIGLEDEFSAMI